MPRWRALPEELDPQVREFAEQLRRLVERSGLGIAAVADRTGYSKTSWERYLNGRLLPPRGAVEALAEAIGTDVGHLVTLWELAERAWSRSELRHDVTMEAVRVAEAKAALGEYGPPPATAERAEPPAAVAAAVTAVRGEDAGRPATPAGGSGSADVRAKAIPVRGPRSRRPGGPRRTRLLFVVGAVGALFVIAAAVLLLGSGDDGKVATPAPASVSPSAGSPSAAPAGVKCAGSACAGQDPETMGCGGSHATTAGSATVGTSYLEVRYSKVCGAAWARITQAAAGDTLRISAGGAGAAAQSGRVGQGADGHTRMIAVGAPEQASACATLTSGRKGCTVPRTASPGEAATAG
ncbi:transcriptional regulator with XRE-family HTH domain [Streptomyces olivoverticillatus]|uniref:Transcriptional regulator with XRE-family HTH domain n=1 Tax=Streptomyces olivoverticillatus TaxID=66427 RepID=A0A7W7PJ43_9ACTN|nr:XRE family transcriptional regulator [Streptomyces olivoverticillatus]MBB4891769.1 transcriptional regulator with XRE-family HTH domain [Streptomyces olivoverticillatus]